jgi:hypothetical protein
MDEGLELDRHDVQKVAHRLRVNVSALRRLHKAAGKEIVRLGRPGAAAPRLGRRGSW